MKCVGFYVGAVKYKSQVANIRIYVVNKDVEPLLSGPAAEALGILTLNTENEHNNLNAECSIRRTSVKKESGTNNRKTSSLFHWSR